MPENLTNDEKLKFTSTAPICDEKKYGVYADIMDQQVKASNVYNIGIIATYGAGKSSLIKTFKDKKLGRFERRKVTTISLANFNSPDDEPDDKQSDKETNKGNSTQGESTIFAPVQDINCDIEKSILEQILFKEKKSKLPHSRIKRIDNRHCWLSFLIALMMTATIGLVCCGVLEWLNKLPHSDGTNFYYFFGFAAGCVLLLIFMLLYSNKLNKISVKDIEADICDNSNYSVLNTFIDEILYYFKKTKTNIVIIEDLDRFDNTHIFSKLRELNFLINNSKIVKQKVTFIYAVKDTLFKTENDRAKFFDYIISLVPVLSFTNARDLLKSEMKKLCPDYMLLPESFIYEVSHFITEMRILKNVINDYMTYYKILNVKELNTENKNIKLFSLILYKNLRPADYAKLQFDNGELVGLFEKKKVKINEQIETLKKEILALEQKLVLANDINLKTLDTFKSFLKGIIVDAKQARTAYNNYDDIDTLQSFENINGGLKFDQQLYMRSYGNITVTSCCSVAYLEEQLGDKLINFEKRIKEKAAINLAAVNSELTKKRQQLKNLLNLSIQEYIKENEKFVSDELKSFFLSNGYVAEDYKDFIAHSDQDLLTANDSAFVRSVLAKRILEYGYRLDNPLNVIQEIQPERFSDKFVLNFGLVSYLLSYKDKKDSILCKRENLIKYLNSRENIVKTFCKDFVCNNYNSNVLVSALTPTNQYFAYDILTNNEISDIFKCRIIKNFIENFKHDDIINLNNKNCISEFLNSCKNILDEISVVNKEKFEALSSTLKLKIKYLNCEEENYDVANYFIENNLFELNANNLEFIFCSINHVDISQYYKTPLTVMINLKNENFVNFITGKLQEILKIIIDFESQTYESQSTIELVLNSNKTPDELCRKFIDKQSECYNYFSCTNSGYLEYMFQTDKIKIDWANIIQADKDGLNWDSIIDFLIKNSKEFGKKQLADKDLIIALCNDVKYKSLNDFDNLSKSFNVDLEIADINEDAILATLIKNSLIQSNEQNFKSLNEKPNSIVKMLTINPEFVESIDNAIFSNDTIDALILNKELKDDIKAKIIKNSSYIPNVSETIEKSFDILLNNPIDKCPYNLILKVIKNVQTSNENKLNFIGKNDADLTKNQYIDLLIEIEPNLSELKTEKEIKLGHDKISNEILMFLDNKNLCKFKKFEYGVRITKK
ncbi:MAG: hypothetical protein K2L02_05445 [Clostridia bacterium]|nr:hypothetical protein [Clostridia bacterium]